MIVIVDYGMGNLGSLLNMFRYLKIPACIESDPKAMLSGKKFILPGVGAFDAAMHRINIVAGLRDVLNQKVFIEKTPILGVCLGMQLLTCGSEEGQLPGLGWIEGHTRRFPRNLGLKVPHMGWNIAASNFSDPLLNGVGTDPRYYFVHSYCVSVDDISHSLMRTQYGINFDSAIVKDNIYGVQFHPEKSHRFGMQILKNFAGL